MISSVQDSYRAVLGLDEMSRIIHVRMVDPVYEEIKRILLILQNSDGSWGTADSLNERIYPTAWVLHALFSQGLNEPLEKTFNLLREQVVTEIEANFNLSNFAHVQKLYGVVMVLPFIFKRRLWESEESFLTNIKQVLDYAESKSWINTQLASYVSFFLRYIPDLSQYAERAEKALPQLENTNVANPFIALGSREYLRRIVSSDVFLKQVNSIPDEELAHFLVAISMSMASKRAEGKATLARVKERLVTTIQKRHLTELDKRVTKEILDMLLLLRAGIDKRELQDRLRRLGGSLYLKDIESSESYIKLIIEIPSKGLFDILGRIDLVVLSAYILSASKLGEMFTYLVPEKDYQLIRPFFENPTFPIPVKRALFYEAILGFGMWSIVLGGILVLVLLLSTQFPQLPVQERITITTFTNLGVIVGAFSIFSRLFRYFFPELSSCIGSKVPKGITSNKFWKKLSGG